MIAKVVRDIPASGIRRFFDILATMKDVISLGVGEPDFPTPWQIREEAIYSIEKGWTTYTSNAGLIELREKIAETLCYKHNLLYNPLSEILITQGVSQGIDLALRAILNPGDEVLIPEPSYVSYKPCTLLAGGKPVAIPTLYEDRFKIRPKAISDAISDKTKAIILCYPNNPTGVSYTKDELLGLADLCKKNNLIVISDEIYEHLSYEQPHIPFASLETEKTIYLSGFSKGYAMTGWRVGYAAAKSDIISAMCKIQQYTILCPPTISQRAAISALSSNSWNEMKEEYEKRRNLMVSGLNSIGLECLLPDGAIFAFPSVKSSCLSSSEFAERLLFSEKVAVVPGDAFGECGEGFVRTCFAVKEDKIEESLIRIKRFLTKL
ncbi:MAG: aminotransferase class I/II-fold pyridoxal phosphate-dependent enzyme [bacterium]|nr:aminotransferase class I/II-fold pyridoxal phosphate-dependent enzyme [bacterium]